MLQSIQLKNWLMLQFLRLISLSRKGYTRLTSFRDGYNEASSISRLDYRVRFFAGFARV